jgi:hypothetical protein
VNLIVHEDKWREGGSSWGIKLISPHFFIAYKYKKKENLNVLLYKPL